MLCVQSNSGSKQLREICKVVYDQRKESPVWWFNKSSDLHASAGALWIILSKKNNHEIQEQLGLAHSFSMEVACWPVYKMLYGMSLELILKAISVASGSKPRHSHNLVQLAGDVDIALSEDEKNILQLLTESIVWDGRYPVPKEKVPHEEHIKKIGEVLFESTNPDLGWENLNVIFGKLSEKFFEKERMKSTRNT